MKVSILSNVSYRQLRQVNFNQMFGVRQRYWIETSLFLAKTLLWYEASLLARLLFFGEREKLFLYIHQRISISGTRSQFTKYMCIILH